MAYTIKGLAKANECETFDAMGLAQAWDYWYICNYGSRKRILTDFKRLRKDDRKEMIAYLRGYYNEVYDFIVDNII